MTEPRPRLAGASSCPEWPSVRPPGRRATLESMSSARVVVFPPAESGGRRVTVDGVPLGTAFSTRDVAVFLERAGLEGWDELDVAQHAELIDWRGGGPDQWEH